jgi:Cu-Zn family superoxide dismutase
MLRKLWTTNLAASAAFGVLMASTPAFAQSGVKLLPLPDAAAYPEGVTVDPTTGAIYTNSANTGAIFRIDPDTGAAVRIGDPLDMGDSPPAKPVSVALGLKADGQGRLWVAGARTGSMHVVDIAPGDRLARFTTPAGAWLINDVALTADAAYFTDTLRPVLWRVARDSVADAALEPWLSFEGTALEYGEEPNLNGIVATPDGRYLIVVLMKTGRLFRIDTLTRDVATIDTGASALDGGDGLALVGQRLFLVRQSAGEVVALDLSPDLSAASEVKRIKPAELAWPATIAVRGDRLIVANSQLNRRASGNPILPFSLVSIPLSAFD